MHRNQLAEIGSPHLFFKKYNKISLIPLSIDTFFFLKKKFRLKITVGRELFKKYKRALSESFYQKKKKKKDNHDHMI